MLPCEVRAGSQAERRGQELDFHIQLQHTVPGRGPGAGARGHWRGAVTARARMGTWRPAPNVCAWRVTAQVERSFCVRECCSLRVWWSGDGRHRNLFSTAFRFSRAPLSQQGQAQLRDN